MKGVIIFLLFVIAGCVIYFLAEYEKKKLPEKKGASYGECLPSLSGKLCEIELKNPLLQIDIAYSVTGIISDFDDEWVAVRVEEKKRTVTKIFRISNIGNVKELRQI